MKFSYLWLCERVELDIPLEALVKRLTMAGLEVDSVASAAQFSKVVVGEVCSCEQHPDANKLKVTQIATPNETVQVVCGASNVKPGIKVAFAQVGAVLAKDFIIKKATLRGVSSCGMLCSENELGLGEASDGIMILPDDAPVGEDLIKYLKLDDYIIDVDLTPNRGDCLGIEGIAREVSASMGARLPKKPIDPVVPSSTLDFPFSIQAPEACHYYTGRVIEKIDPNSVTPLWMIEALRRSGIRSINPVVDITNFVMIETGQPLHGFDLQKLDSAIEVRYASAGEKLKLLNDQIVNLTESTLIIADKSGPLCLAGVMGGASSGVDQTTTSVFLEAAFFSPQKLAGIARHYGVHTDSSHRFERGVDIKAVLPALERATALILQICGGSAGVVCEVKSDCYVDKQNKITLHANKIYALLGIELAHDVVIGYLCHLGCSVENHSDGIWQVTIPSWRYDLTLEEHLIEEIARLHGYDTFPESHLVSEMRFVKNVERQCPLSRLSHILVSRGYREVINYSFIDPKWHELFDPSRDPITLKKPISSDMSVMRTCLMPGLVKSAIYNLSRQCNRVKFFETGQTFVRSDQTDDMIQNFHLAAVSCGLKYPEGWHGEKREVNFFDIKNELQTLLELICYDGTFFFRPASNNPALHPGQCADVFQNDKKVGVIGALHPSLFKTLDISKQLYLFELNLSLVKSGNIPFYKPLSKFPEVRRDIAIVVDQEISASEIESVIYEQAGECLTSVVLFDVYTGDGIEDNQKSLAFGITWRHHNRTLTDKEVNDLLNKVVESLKKQMNAILRQ